MKVNYQKLFEKVYNHYCEVTVNDCIFRVKSYFEQWFKNRISRAELISFIIDFFGKSTYFGNADQLQNAINITNINDKKDFIDNIIFAAIDKCSNQNAAKNFYDSYRNYIYKTINFDAMKQAIHLSNINNKSFIDNQKEVESKQFKKNL